MTKRNPETRRLSALEVANRQKLMVLLGDPGSGKTTFVNFVTLCLAGESLRHPEANLSLLTAPIPTDEGEDEEKRQPWEHGPLLPVRIILRDFAARNLPDTEASASDLWQFVEDELTRAELSEFAPLMKRELQEKGGLIMLDGLDEVPEADNRRALIKSVPEDFIRTFHRCRVLVTSRTYAYQKQDWRISGLHESVLASFSKGQIIRFIDRWYAHFAELRHGNFDDALGRAELLKRAVFSSGRLRELAERPLLLTLMASLHSKGASPYGTLDMSGNVWEWCLDRCDWKDGKFITDTYKDGLADPVCTTGSSRVYRGGSFIHSARYCRSAFRVRDAPGGRDNFLGFRLVRSAPLLPFGFLPSERKTTRKTDKKGKKAPIPFLIRLTSMETAERTAWAFSLSYPFSM